MALTSDKKPTIIAAAVVSSDSVVQFGGDRVVGRPTIAEFSAALNVTSDLSSSDSMSEPVDDPESGCSYTVTERSGRRPNWLGNIFDTLDGSNAIINDYDLFHELVNPPTTSPTIVLIPFGWTDRVGWEVGEWSEMMYRRAINHPNVLGIAYFKVANHNVMRVERLADRWRTEILPIALKWIDDIDKRIHDDQYVSTTLATAPPDTSLVVTQSPDAHSIVAITSEVEDGKR
jgi:hypothetical protein